MNKINEKIVLITGATSGIGLAITKYLAMNNFIVFAGGRNQEKLNKLNHNNIRLVNLDITKPEQIQKAYNEIKDYCEQSDHFEFCLINNAGIVKAGPLEFLPAKELANQLHVNVTCQMQVTQIFLPLLRKSVNAKIIFTGSNSGYFSAPLLGAYNASKHALEGLVDTLRRELIISGSSIKVCLLQPGQFKSEIWSKTKKESTQISQSYPREFEKFYGEITKKILSEAEKADKGGDDPIIIAKIVLKILNQKNPRIRHKMGKNTALAFLLGKIFPQNVTDYLISKKLKNRNLKL